VDQDRSALANGVEQWSKTMGILDQQLQKTGAYVSGEQFSLADIPIGLSVNRWLKRRSHIRTMPPSGRITSV
jgi:glutathione S-transferase